MDIIQYLRIFHCVKSVQIRIFSGLYFPVFGLNTDIWGGNLHIQSEYRKIWIRKNSPKKFVFDRNLVDQKNSVFGHLTQCLLLTVNISARFISFHTGINIFCIFILHIKISGSEIFFVALNTYFECICSFSVLINLSVFLNTWKNILEKDSHFYSSEKSL